MSLAPQQSPDFAGTQSPCFARGSGASIGILTCEGFITSTRLSGTANPPPAPVDLSGQDFSTLTWDYTTFGDPVFGGYFEKPDETGNAIKKVRYAENSTGSFLQGMNAATDYDGGDYITGTLPYSGHRSAYGGYVFTSPTGPFYTCYPFSNAPGIFDNVQDLMPAFMGSWCLQHNDNGSDDGANHPSGFTMSGRHRQKWNKPKRVLVIGWESWAVLGPVHSGMISFGWGGFFGNWSSRDDSLSFGLNCTTFKLVAPMTILPANTWFEVPAPSLSVDWPTGKLGSGNFAIFDQTIDEWIARNEGVTVS